VATAAALASLAALFSADEAGSRQPDAVAAGLLVAAAASLLLRRHRPRTALFGTVGLTLVYLALNYPGGAELPVLMVAFYSIAAAGQRWETVLVVVLFGGGGAVHRAVVEREPFLEIALTVALLVLAFLFGDSVSTRRRLRAEVRARLRAAAVEKELEAEARVSGERVRIAQELHDVLAHTVTTMTVHAGAAADLLPDQPEQARRSLATLRSAGREAMAELRATMLTAYRVVQEALTNVIRHARASRATVRVSVGRSAVEVTVEDDGAGRPSAPEHRGSGLLGLTERARALGGVLSAGNRPGGGFRVQATLPAPEADP
jgi:signal transduction histidine kinase